MTAGVVGTSNPLYGIDDLKLGYTVAVTAAASAASGATTLTVAAGQGAQFAGAGVSTPIELTYGTEKLLVTGQSTDTLTVTRANYGTTAAVIASAATGYGIFEVDMGMAQDLTIDPQITQIEYTGDGTKVRIPVSEGVSGKFNFEFFTEEFLQYIAGCTVHSTTLPADETNRVMPQLGTYPNTRIRARIRQIDTTAGGVAGHKRIEIPKAIIQRPFTFNSIASTAATKYEVQFTALPTLVDISGAPLPHIGTDPVQIVIATLTS
jgi:hypothetical protein